VQRYLPPHLHYQEAPYVPPTALVVPVAHDDPRDPYVVACDATPVPTTYDDDDTTVSRDPQPSKPRRSPRDSQLSRMICSFFISLSLNWACWFIDLY
ncbi:hypothetical protein Tco_1552558, partial [Tanacetum coccineum]